MRQQDEPLPIVGFEVSGFRTLHDVEVRPSGPATVLCGPNNVGKSSFLDLLAEYPRIIRPVFNQQGRTGKSSPAPAGADSARVRVAISLTSAALRDKVSEDRPRRAKDLDALLEALDDHLLWIPFTLRKGDWSPDYKSAANAFLSQLGSVDVPTVRQWQQSLARPFERSEFDAAWIGAVARLCLTRVQVRKIGDIRRTPEQPLTHDELWMLAIAHGRRPGSAQRVEDWATKLENILREVFGDEVRYEVRPLEGSGDFRLMIDGEEDRELETVGAGVREVVAIAFAALNHDGAQVLAIEEPENCLHPVAAKRLMRALPAHADVQLFVSTHSSAVVNANPDTIVHLRREGTTTSSRQVSDAPMRYEAVRELGYSPADLVLTPCAIWVEGPSDRVYITNWLAKHDLIEGVDYQVMYLAGSLSAHITTSQHTLPRPTLAAIRSLSRHTAIVLDSDRDKPHARLKRFVLRFKEELEGDDHAHLLITHGREIENYLPLEIANQLRREHRTSQLTQKAYRYSRVITTAMAKRPGKVEIAKRAVGLLNDDVPDAARADMRQLATFVRAATPD